ncbi:Spy/CpxP family protein refolding chaperone [Stakelama sp. CBK3Z-3]|uniref:Spy/CpxP family protein refolding chaperone n=1 Tax=Stakelama flava TaxID=2860338 RepID=A0ABS6XK19_9SPHN|nr:Spy/CpxP family protein refolding chaperone [Stakelama flava]MBW4330551.1 Spy/CpxP family protein refolding chaperone [Stakelama flava]
MIKAFILAGVMASAVGTPAMAQQRPPANAPGMPDNAMDQQRVDDMALLLNLRADQRPALEAYLKASAPPHRGGGPRPGGKPDQNPGRQGGPGDRGNRDGAANPPPPPSATSFDERLADMERREAEHGEQARQRIAALKSFYQALDAQQRTRFEAILRLDHGPDGFAPPPGPGGPHDGVPPSGGPGGPGLPPGGSPKR